MIRLRSCFFGITAGVVVFTTLDLIRAYCLQPYQNVKNLAFLNAVFFPVTWLFYLMVGFTLRLTINILMRPNINYFRRSFILSLNFIAVIAFYCCIFLICTILFVPPRYSMLLGSTIGEAFAFQAHQFARDMALYLAAYLIGIIVFAYDNLRER